MTRCARPLVTANAALDEKVRQAMGDADVPAAWLCIWGDPNHEAEWTVVADACEERARKRAAEVDAIIVPLFTRLAFATPAGSADVWRYVKAVGDWETRGLDEADFRIAGENGYDIQTRFASRSAGTAPDGPLAGKYGEVLRPFLALMERELHANAGKGDRPGWLAMDRKTALLEIFYHLAKLQKAAKDDDRGRIREHGADVANMAMMLVDVCGALNVGTRPAITSPSPGVVLPARRDEMASINDEPWANGYDRGWNACRDAMLAAATEVPRVQGTF